MFRTNEKIESLIFVKEGQLSLCTIIDSKDAFGSIKKFIRNLFKISVFKNKNNTFLQNNDKDDDYIPQTTNQYEILEKELTMGQNNTKNSFLHETYIDDEIEKLSFNDEDDNNNGNIFLPIINICKNENFGLIKYFV